MQTIRQLLNFKNDSYPLNIFDVCDSINSVEIAALPFKNPNLRGMVTVGQNDDDKSVILVNSNKTVNEQNYHGSHEFLHIWFQDIAPGMSLNCFEKCLPSQNCYIEWIANEGAAEFLVPYKILLPLVKENYQSMLEHCGTYSFCEEYAEKFCVTLMVMQNRLNALKYEIHQYVEEDIALENIRILSKAKQDNLGIKIKSLNNLEDERLFQQAIDFYDLKEG